MTSLLNILNIRSRSGRIYLAFDMFTRDNSEVMGLLFSRFVPNTVHVDWQEHRIEYTGWSPEFDVVPGGERLPTYNVMVRRDQDEHRYFHTLWFEKVETVTPFTPKRLVDLGPRMRCMGPWPGCGHREGLCTASPDYQAALKR